MHPPFLAGSWRSLTVADRPLLRRSVLRADYMRDYADETREPIPFVSDVALPDDPPCLRVPAEPTVAALRDSLMGRLRRRRAGSRSQIAAVAVHNVARPNVGAAV